MVSLWVSAADDIPNLDVFAYLQAVRPRQAEHATAAFGSRIRDDGVSPTARLPSVTGSERVQCSAVQCTRAARTATPSQAKDDFEPYFWRTLE